MRGKLIWKSLKTDRISVAKLRLGDFHKEERQRAAARKAVARGKMMFGDALQTYRQERLAALLKKSWPDPEQDAKVEICCLRLRTLLVVYRAASIRKNDCGLSMDAMRYGFTSSGLSRAKRLHWSSRFSLTLTSTVL